jgi:hypothetical protein
MLPSRTATNSSDSFRLAAALGKLPIKRLRTHADLLRDIPPLPLGRELLVPCDPGIEPFGNRLQRKDFGTHPGVPDLVSQIGRPRRCKLRFAGELQPYPSALDDANPGHSNCHGITMIDVAEHRCFRQDRTCRGTLQDYSTPIILMPNKPNLPRKNQHQRRHHVVSAKEDCTFVEDPLGAGHLYQFMKHDRYHVNVCSEMTRWFSQMKGMQMNFPVTALSLVLLLSTPIAAQEHSGTHMHGMDDVAMTDDGEFPIEAGQAAFTAIQEIVALLENDPTTDWSKVNIEVLRQHLIDMDNVTMSARVDVQEDDGSIRFMVSGTGSAIGSIRRMVAAHASTMDGKNGYRFSSTDIAEGAVLTVTPDDPSGIAKLRALSFIGVMAQGMHHQMHHLMLANGQSPHN